MSVVPPFLPHTKRGGSKADVDRDQRWAVEHAADRTPFVCQSQSVNLFLPANVHKRDLHQIHVLGWKRGLKSLYYCRSLSIARADTVSDKVGANDVMNVALTGPVLVKAAEKVEYEECLACQ